jgi:hypothetical protein
MSAPTMGSHGYLRLILGAAGMAPSECCRLDHPHSSFVSGVPGLRFAPPGMTGSFYAFSASSDSGRICPPSTMMVWPVMYPASFDARKSAA